MDELVQSLAADTGANPDKAVVVAARILAHVRERLRNRYGEPAARAFTERIPLSGAPACDLLHAPVASGALGVDALVEEMIGDAGLDPVQAGLAVPALTKYFKSRLPTDVLRQVLQVAPFLTMAAPERPPA